MAREHKFKESGRESGTNLSPKEELADSSETFSKKRTMISVLNWPHLFLFFTFKKLILYNYC